MTYPNTAKAAHSIAPLNSVTRNTANSHPRILILPRRLLRMPRLPF